MTSPIHIITASDKNFGQHTGIMLMSLLASSSPSQPVKICILDGGIDPNDRAKINRICSKHNTTPRYISIENERIANAKVDGHVSIATYYRILLADLFPDLNKILYIDSDVVVTAPLNELWNIDLENYYAAAVLDPGITDSEYIKSLGLPGSETYFNAGVLLINLEKWREDKITDKLVERVQNNHQLLRTWDQDAINAELWRKTKIIHPKFNVMVHFLRKHLPSPYPKNEIEEAIKNPVIVHYNSPDKPWNTYCQNKLKHYYREYWKNSEWKNVRRTPTSFPLAVKTFLLNNLSKNQIFLIKRIKKIFRSLYSKSLIPRT